MWRLPLGPGYDKMIRSKIADMKNIGGANAGSITAAQFLKRFIEDGTPWAHLDIAGVAWQDGEQKALIAELGHRLGRAHSKSPGIGPLRIVKSPRHHRGRHGGLIWSAHCHAVGRCAVSR